MFHTELSQLPSLNAHFTTGVKLGSSRGSAKSVEDIESQLVSLNEPGDPASLNSFFVLNGVLTCSISSASSNWLSSGSYLGFFLGVSWYCRDLLATPDCNPAQIKNAF